MTTGACERMSRRTEKYPSPRDTESSEPTLLAEKHILEGGTVKQTTQGPSQLQWRKGLHGKCQERPDLLGREQGRARGKGAGVVEPEGEVHMVREENKVGERS